jgi:L-alanine-DL-glutamate epimerase-like enolase superfamily enzyme
MRVADLASVWGLKCMPHVNCGAGHDIGVVATAHCLAAMSNAMYLCYPVYDSPLRTELLLEQPKVINGQFALPEKPGLGIEINQEVAYPDIGRHVYLIHPNAEKGNNATEEEIVQ